MKRKKATIIVPRTVHTFLTLPGETLEDARNRFIYNILADEQCRNKFLKYVTSDSFAKLDPNEEVNVTWLGDKKIDKGLLDTTERNM